MDSPKTSAQCSCGSRCFEILTPVRGIWREYVTFHEDGSRDHAGKASTDDIVCDKPPKTMKCVVCSKQLPNPLALS
jgi:hypothetical protein